MAHLKTNNTFGFFTRFLHWSIAVLVLGLFFLGLWLRTLDYYSPWYTLAPNLHFSFGIVCFVLVVVRIIWRFFRETPTPLGDNRLEHAVAGVVHAFLYALMIAMMITGYLYATADDKSASVFGIVHVPVIWHSKTVADTAGDLHEWFAYAIMALVALHVVGALKHHYIDRDDTLRRMVSGAGLEDRDTE